MVGNDNMMCNLSGNECSMGMVDGIVRMKCCIGVFHKAGIIHTEHENGNTNCQGCSTGRR